MSATMMYRPTAVQIRAEQWLERAARQLADHIRAHPAGRSHVSACPGEDLCDNIRRNLAANLLVAEAEYLRSLR